jgi:hypothetical protein
MRRRRREHSLLLKASKILVSLGASVNLTLSHRRRALRSFPLRRRGATGSAAPAARNADVTSPRREIGVGISPQVEPGVSADENSKLGDGALHAVSTLTLRLFRLAARLPMSFPAPVEEQCPERQDHGASALGGWRSTQVRPASRRGRIRPAW